MWYSKYSTLVSLATLLVALFSTCSCSQQEIIPPAVLELEEYATIDYPIEGGEREVGIKTNQSRWTAVVAGESSTWLRVVQRPGKLLLTAAPNETIRQRAATVVVTAGGETQKVEVRQAGKESTLSISAEELIAGDQSLRLDRSQFAGRTKLIILTEDPDWTYEVVEGPWIKAEKVALESTLLLTVEENKEKSPRSAVLFVRTKDKSVKVEIHQEGILYYLLPLLTPESTKEDVKDYEEARHSRVVENASYLSGGSHTYHTVSPLFYEIKYSFDRRNLREVIMQTQEAEGLLADPFTKLLEAEGFEYKADSGMERVFIKKVKHNGTTYEIFANLVYGMPGKDPHAVFNILKRQERPMPTFDRLPDGMGQMMGVTRQQVIAWESTHGGTYSERNSDPSTGYYFFDVIDKTYVARDYLFVDGKLANMRIFTYDISKFFYSPGKNTFKMTDEFKALLQKEGFTETRTTGDQWERFYINRARKLAVSARVTSFATVLSGQPLVVMLYLPFDESES